MPSWRRNFRTLKIRPKKASNIILGALSLETSEPKGNKWDQVELIAHL